MAGVRGVWARRDVNADRHPASVCPLTPAPLPRKAVGEGRALVSREAIAGHLGTFWSKIANPHKHTWQSSNDAPNARSCNGSGRVEGCQIDTHTLGNLRGDCPGASVLVPADSCSALNRRWLRFRDEDDQPARPDRVRGPGR